MSKFVLYIDVENDAFSGGAQFEVGSILRELSERFIDGERLPDKYRDLRDVNGNIVGKYAVKDNVKIIAG